MCYNKKRIKAVDGGLRMVSGDIKKINLSISSFQQMIEGGYLYVDKTRFIENFLNTASSVQLVARQRRLGKSLNLDMLRCFLTDSEDYRYLFKGLYIENSSVWDKANTAPVLYFDFKNLTIGNYKRVIYNAVCDYFDNYCADMTLPRDARYYLKSNDVNETNGLFYLTEAMYKKTGKRPYLLIDEYDNLLMSHYNTEYYMEIRDFEKKLFEAALKGNRYVEKAFLTGVMRISHESILSGLNNLVTFDVFDDEIYTEDYGLTDSEVEALSKLSNFDTDEARAWYNGIRINSHAVYNVFSIMSFLSHKKKYQCYWGKSGIMGTITGLLNDARKYELAKMMAGEKVEVPVETRISLEALSSEEGDEAFYSYLVQAGYLSIEENNTLNNRAVLAIPNKELMIVWKNFILTNLYKNSKTVRTLFDHAHDAALFASDVEYFLNDRLSYYDLSVLKREDARKVYERTYHTFMLGILSAYADVQHRPVSNRESGDGRFDILVQRSKANYIFEFKACVEDDDLIKFAHEALEQINAKRYGADLADGKPLVKIGVAIHGKQCKVICRF